MGPAELQPWAGPDDCLGVLDDALAGAAADHVEIFVAARTGQHIRFAGERVHQPQTIIECQVMVRAVAGTGAARVAVSSLAGARGAVAAATDLARRRDGAPGAAPPHGVAGASAADATAGLWHDATVAFDAGERSALAGRIMDAARRAGGTAAGVLTTAVTELAVATTGGQRCYAAATEAGFSLTARIGEALVLCRRSRPRRGPAGGGRASGRGHRSGGARRACHRGARRRARRRVRRPRGRRADRLPP